MLIASRPLSAETISMSCSSSTVESAKMLRMSSSTIKTFLPCQYLVRLMQVVKDLPFGFGQLGNLAMQEESAQIEQPFVRSGPASRAVLRKAFPASSFPEGVGIAIDDHGQALIRLFQTGVKHFQLIGKVRDFGTRGRRSRSVFPGASGRAALLLFTVVDFDILGGNRTQDRVAAFLVGVDHEQALHFPANESTQRVEHDIEDVPALNRFGNEGQRAGRKSAFPRFVGGNHHNRNVPSRHVVLQSLQDAPALNIGQVDIE